MSFRMKVEDLFRVDQKTIFTGTLVTDEKIISNAICELEIDGKLIAEIRIEGEVHTGTLHRDLWTKEPVKLERSQLSTGDVWLVSR